MSDECSDECVTRVSSVPVVHSSVVCGVQGSKECGAHCPHCPVFCKKTQQSVCNTGHTVNNIVINRREHEEDTTEEVTIREEREVIEMTEDCHNEEIEELCAPVNCKFVNLTKVCKETNETILVDLKEKQCAICKNKIRKVCEEVLTDDCDSEPFDKPWKKFCSDKPDDMNNFIESKQISDEDEQVRSQDISAKKAFLFKGFDPDKSSEFAPEEVSKKSKKLFVQETTTKLSQVDKELIKLVKIEEDLIHEELNVIKKLKTLPTNVNVNLKYNVISSPKSSNPLDQTTTLDPIIRLLETEIHLPNDTDASYQSTQIKRPDISINSKETTTTIEPIIYTTNYTPTEKHYQATTEEPILMKPKKKLSASDFLRLCFTSGIGCDFNENKIKKEIVTTKPSRQQPTETTPTTTSSRANTTSNRMSRN